MLQFVIIVLGTYLLTTIYMGYVGSTYPPIVDIGFNIIPYTPHIPIICDILPYTYVLFGAFGTFSTGGIDLLNRYLHGLGLLILMRCFSLISTIFPETNSEHRPENFLFSFLHGGNHDTVFSGHIAYMIYAAKCFDFWIRPSFYPRLILYLLVFIQCILMITFREHYTVDIVIAIYITLLLFHAQYHPIKF